MKRVFIIENPVASRSTPRGLETVLSVMKSEGWEVATGRTEEQGLSIVVANRSKILPPLLKLGADVTVDDGILDIIILKANGFLGAAWAVWNLLWLQETSRVRRIRGTEVRVETAAPQVVQADGDICGMTPLTATIIPGGLTVMV
ncbi:MAG: hypothetical protein IH849_08550, partial [Acidobacteria bacterium]|nr:hypothetical protein [Acidobacteriota bacterium]